MKNKKGFTLSKACPEHNRRTEGKGFALIELIVVLVVLTIIAIILYICLDRIYRKPSSQIEKPTIVVNIK